MKTVTSEEVTREIQRAVRGEVPISFPGTKWKGSHSGVIEVKIGDWLIAFFNDCEELDYCEYAVSPDGRKSEFDDWDLEPLAQLDEGEFAEFEQLLERA